LFIITLIIALLGQTNSINIGHIQAAAAFKAINSLPPEARFPAIRSNQLGKALDYN